MMFVTCAGRAISLPTRSTVAFETAIGISALCLGVAIMASTVTFIIIYDIDQSSFFNQNILKHHKPNYNSTALIQQTLFHCVYREWEYIDERSAMKTNVIWSSDFFRNLQDLRLKISRNLFT